MKAREASPSLPASFRVKLMAAMMIVVSAIAALVLYFANRNLAESVENNLQQQFRGELEAMHDVQQLRLAALVERCRTLVRRPRIQAALEDGALDLLYPSARDELRDVVRSDSESPPPGANYELRAEFYRFLDRDGALIPPHAGDDVGRMGPALHDALRLPSVSDRRQIGYVAGNDSDGTPVIFEIIAMPIISTETGEPIAALALGFKPVEPQESAGGADIMRGILVDGKLSMPGLDAGEASALAGTVLAESTSEEGADGRFTRTIAGVPHQVFFKHLNPESLYPPALEVCVYPLADLAVRQRQLQWRILGSGGLLLLVALGISLLVSRRLAAPVEKLAVDSVREREGRARAEAALEVTSEELQRAARFSADASHQLKTPVAVLRAGLEGLHSHAGSATEIDSEVSSLIHQTYRLSGIIDDLLLLSRMDAGQLKLTFGDVNLSQLIEASLDDLSALQGASEIKVESEFPQDLRVAGDEHYVAIILQNLLENARKYNRPGGLIRVVARAGDVMASISVGNTGAPVPPQSQGRIFERFHRGVVGENLPGYGLGLNLARELARLHQGTLRLVGSANDWTEFEVQLCISRSGGNSTGSA